MILSLVDLHLKLVAVVALSYLPPFYKCLGIYDMGLYVCCHVLFVCLFSVSTTVTPVLGALYFRWQACLDIYKEGSLCFWPLTGFCCWDDWISAAWLNSLKLTVTIRWSGF